MKSGQSGGAGAIKAKEHNEVTSGGRLCGGNRKRLTDLFQFNQMAPKQFDRFDHLKREGKA